MMLIDGIIAALISMLSEPTDESPVNLDAAVCWRNDPGRFKKICRALVHKSLGGTDATNPGT